MKIQNNVRMNMVLNIIRTLLSVAFPIISYPYATRILHAENYGKVSFSQSIISYVGLLASLGISSYAIREGGFYRNDKKKLVTFASEVFSVNLVSTGIAYGCLIVLLIISDTMRANAILLLIFGLTVILTTIGVDWVNVIFEDYLFITIRSFVIQGISLIMLFILVRDPNDYYKYAIIQVINSGLVAVTNFIHTRKLCAVRITPRLNLKKHLKPMLILFSSSLTISIYLNIDNVFIGFMKGEYYVGVYSVSVKVYTVLKQVVASAYNVTITRMSDYLASGQEKKYNKLLNDVINNIIFMSVPVEAGIICTAIEIIKLLAGEEYMAASGSLKILSIAILFAVLGGALANCVNLPHKREKKNLIGTTFSAMLNLCLNFVAIPLIGINGAAVTTLLAEFFICMYLCLTMKDIWHCFDWNEILKNAIKCFIAIVPFFIFRYMLLYAICVDGYLYLFLFVILAVVSYILVGCIVKNNHMTGIIKSLTSHINI